MSDKASCCVAVVDDDVSICRSLGRMLRAAGLNFVAFHSAEAFLAADTDRFGCILLDVELGGMSGIELHRELIETGRNIPVIFITAHHESDIYEEIRQLPCVAYFSKTEPAEIVLDAIQGVINSGSSD